jgi:hypothetical protein
LAASSECNRKILGYDPAVDNHAESAKTLLYLVGGFRAQVGKGAGANCLRCAQAILLGLCARPHWRHAQAHPRAAL